MSSPVAYARWTAEQWQAALAMEEDARRELEALDRATVSDVDRRNTAQIWFTIASEIMEQHLINCREEGDGRQVPFNMIWALTRMLKQISNGTIPSPIHDAMSLGRNKRTAEESLHIAYASAYLQAAKAGRLDDKQPIATIMEAYGVQRQTVQRWRDEQVPPLLADHITKLSGEEVVQYLRKSIDEWGRFYRNAGRSTEAQSRQARKRKK